MANEPFLQKARNAERLLGAARMRVTMGDPEPAVKLTLAQADDIMAALDDAQTMTEIVPFLQRARNAAGFLETAMESKTPATGEVKITSAQANEIGSVLEDGQTIAELNPP
jgi:hypothetical protein